jgi:hypothetical protein
MLIRFTIEQRHLTDDTGKPVASEGAVTFHSVEGESVDDVIRLFVYNESGEVIGNILKFPGFQAVATVRKNGGVYTLQVTPSSQQWAPVL